MTPPLRKYLVIPDCQIPYHDRLSMKAVERYMADEDWYGIIYLGDFMDFHQLAKFNKDSPDALTKSLKGDYDMANAILDRHTAILKKRNQKFYGYFLMGNHENRVNKFAESFPQLKGIIDVDVNLKLKERGFEVIRSYPDGETLRIGNAYFHHGLYTSANHPKKMADNFGVNIFYGHTHDVQSYSKVLWGKNKTIVGQSLGCLCRYDLDYVGLNPTNWTQAVTTLLVRPDGYFNHYVSSIFNHKFTAPNGKTYRP